MRAVFHSVWLAAAVSCAALFSAAAHEGPEAEIAELTERLQVNGETAGLLAERAIEYRVLGKLPEATKDLERATVLDPKSIGLCRELARVQFLGGKGGDAIATVTRGLTLKADEPADLAALRMLRAEILRSQNDDKKALEDCDAALRLHRQNPEWYLLRSDLQRRLKMPKERVTGLEEGIKATGAGVLEIERIEALLDAAQFAAALPVIETELADSRIKSSWLIRRARVRLGLGKKAEADDDLKAALKEIGTRLNPKAPDVPLLLDKALALDLLGEKKGALRAYEEARDKGATESVNEKIKAIQDSGTTSPPPAPVSNPDK